MLAGFGVRPRPGDAAAPALDRDPGAARPGHRPDRRRLMVSYRDVQYILPVAMHPGSTPARSPTPAPPRVPARYQAGLSALNPLSGLLEAFRWSLLGTGAPTGRPWPTRRPSPSLALLVGGRLGFQADGAEVRRCHLTTSPSPSAACPSRTRSPAMPSSTPLAESCSGRRGTRAPARHGDVLGAQGRLLRHPAGRGRRRHRPQRRGQEHAPEGPQPDHRADRRARSSCGAGSAACSRSGPGSTPS